MSGHSKWSTIKHKKAATDAKRGKAFTRLAKEITVAAREGGGDPAGNVRLRLAIDKARANNMPKDNIERAVKRGTGELEGGELFEIAYEAYAPHGIAMLIEVMTDNKNRTLAEVRHVLNKYGGSMAEAGSVAWQFSRKGYFHILPNQVEDQDTLFMTAAEAGAEDVEFGEDGAEIYCDLDSFQTVRSTLEEAGYPLEEASVYYEAKNRVELERQPTSQIMNLVELLEELDDVQDVYTSMEVSDAMMAELEEA
jgi:YebC/PmpR family DNA-binding regulatory protein